MDEKIEKLKDELKIILDEEYTFIDYLIDIWNSPYTGIKEKHEAREMLNYIYNNNNNNKNL